MQKQQRIYVLVLSLALLGGAILGLSGDAMASYEHHSAIRMPLAPVGTGFTYQGYLELDGKPVDDLCDFKFSLWDAEAAGIQIGVTLKVNNLQVSNGYLASELDFGSGVFDGQARWLEIAASCPTEKGTFTTLGRVHLTATPYALYALDAGQLNGQPGSHYQTRVDVQCALGSSVRAINADGSIECQRDAPLNRNQTPETNSFSMLDDAGGWYSSATIGVDGLGLISYLDEVNKVLKVAHCDDLACTSANITTLDDSSNVGLNTSLALGADGLGLISYRDYSNNDLKVAHCEDLACTSATITTLDNSGDIGHDPSVTIGGDGLGLISYYDATNKDLKVAHCDDLACTTATITKLDSSGDVGQHTSITVGTDGLGLIGYYDATNKDLKVAHCDDLACTTATITTLDSSGNIGRYSSVTIGIGGLGLIAYNDDTNNTLKVAHCDDLACTSATISPLGAGSHASLTIGADGLGLISFDDKAGTLKVAHCDNPACTSATYFTLEALSPSGSSYMGAALTIGVDGYGLISYRDPADSDLKVVHCGNTFCLDYLRRR